ncbi:MAG: diguanylate cyclase [Lachnospiraceae bacterium]|nr:diguanylate cyclase [Lachnospiraceae bacterium]MDD3660745.1 diguanylate cyclase [Lachnospiraceae bacterium]
MDGDVKKRYRILTMRLILAAGILAALLIGMQIMTQLQMNQMTGMEKVINVAGRQRMLSQKITKELLYLKYYDQAEDYEIEVMNDLVFQFESAHYSLLLGNNLRDIPDMNNEEILQKYQEIKPYFLEIIENAEAAVNEITLGHGKDHWEPMMDQILQSEKQYLLIMDEIVLLYETESSDLLQVSKVSHMILNLLILLLSGLVFWKLLIPVSKELKNGFEQQFENAQNIRKMFYHLKAGVFLIRPDGRIIFQNKEAQNLTGFEEEEVQDINILEHVKWMDLNIKRLLDDVKSGKSAEDIETNVEDKNGINRTVMLTITSTTHQKEDALMLSLFDITVQKRAEEELTGKANKDELTGLYNRHFLDFIIQEEIERAERYEIPLSAILLDLDHFKRINDRWGHPVGDSVLISTSELIQKFTRISDYVFRIGGEEFLILMPHTNISGAVTAAEKIRKEIEESIHVTAGKFTASFGVAERCPGETFRTLYKRIDDALYEAKNSGRNCIVKSENPCNGYATIGLKWKKSWECGENKIDEQHRELFRLSGNFANNNAFHKDREKAVSYLEQIIQHVIEHFEYEESALSKAGYQDLNRHKKIHGNLIKKANEMKELYSYGSIDSIKVFTFLFDEVIIGHLLSEDIKFHDVFLNL